MLAQPASPAEAPRIVNQAGEPSRGTKPGNQPGAGRAAIRLAARAYPTPPQVLYKEPRTTFPGRIFSPAALC